MSGSALALTTRRLLFLLIPYPLHLAAGDLLLAPVIELGGARVGVALETASVKQALSALRMLFDWLVVHQVVASNPTMSVCGPKLVTSEGKTPVLSPEEVEILIEKTERRLMSRTHRRSPSCSSFLLPSLDATGKSCDRVKVARFLPDPQRARSRAPSTA